jgi:hypothetical protein
MRSSLMNTSSCGFRTGSVRSRTRSITVNIATLVPMPRASDIVAVAVNVGVFQSCRKA